MVHQFQCFLTGHLKIDWQNLISVITMATKIAHWCDHTIFSHTAKNLVAHATSWWLNLSPGLGTRMYYSDTGYFLLILDSVNNMYNVSCKTTKPKERRLGTILSVKINKRQLLGALYLSQTFIELIAKLLQSFREDTFLIAYKEQHLVWDLVWLIVFSLGEMQARLHCSI